ncbi:hypothetical protein GJAV_G00261290, partial [Gymnothorax javanicus]
MSKLQALNSYLTERLMVAVQEILDVVKQTVSEYLEENARTKRENESLRRRLWKLEMENESTYRGGRLAALSVLREKPLVVSRGWSSGLVQTADLAVTERSQELADNRAGRLREEVSNPSSPVKKLKKLALEITLSMVSPFSVNPENDSIQNSDVSIMEPVNAEATSQPALRVEQIKTEPVEVDLKYEELAVSGRNSKPQDDITETRRETTVGARCDKVAEASLNPLSDPASLAVDQRDERQHSCSQCGKCFCRVSYVKIHQQIHAGERPYSCSWCRKTFTQSGDLRRHERIHTGDKPHQCMWCEKSFTQVGNLKRHQRIHTGERPYCCSLCGKTFYDGGALKNHKRVHLQELKQR